LNIESLSGMAVFGELEADLVEIADDEKAWFVSR
jgi:hypothetical protein